MMGECSDPIEAFYDRHPYPPPLDDLDEYLARSDAVDQRVEHHRRWPHLPYRADHTILVAGCGTSQAAKYAARFPRSRVVGVDVSEAAIAHTRALAGRHHLHNLTLQRLPIPEVGQLGESFDHIVCTGVLHHLVDPDEGLRALRNVLAPEGAIDVMVYARYGRTGIYMLQEYCRRLGIEPSAEDLKDLRTSLEDLPPGHPVSHLFRGAPDFGDDSALADALLNPRDRSYSVPEVLELARGAGLRFGRWVRQAPYLPTCGAPATVAHSARMRSLPVEEQYAALELYRGTMTRHSFVAYREDATRLDPAHAFEAGRWRDDVALRPSTTVLVTSGLPEGAAAAVLNSAHEFSDLVLLVDERRRAMYEAIDGTRTLGEISTDEAPFFRHLFEHDLIVLDASAQPHGEPE